MSREENYSVASFLKSIEKAGKEILVHHHGVEHIQRETYKLLMLLSKKLIEAYYAELFKSLDNLFFHFNQRNSQKITGLYKEAIEKYKLPAVHFSVEQTHPITQVPPEGKAVLADMDEQFYELKKAYRVTGEVLSEKTEKLTPDEKKEIAIIHEQSKKLAHDYQSFALAAMMLVAGVLLIGVTHGIGAAAGAALIMEGVNKIHHLIGHHDAKPQNAVATFDHNTTELLQKLSEAEKNNHAMFNDAWIEYIQAHCEKQKKILGRNEIRIAK